LCTFSLKIAERVQGICRFPFKVQGFHILAVFAEMVQGINVFAQMVQGFNVLAQMVQGINVFAKMVQGSKCYLSSSKYSPAKQPAAI
jgi:hypothetical protein